MASTKSEKPLDNAETAAKTNQTGSESADQQQNRIPSKPCKYILSFNVLLSFTCIYILLI